MGCPMNKNPRPPPPAGQSIGTSTSSGPNRVWGKLVTTGLAVGPLGGTCYKPRQYIRCVKTNFEPPRVTLEIGECTVKALVDSGAGRSIISSKFFEQLRQAGVGFHFSKNVDVNLFDINERRLVCFGKITTEMLVEGEQPHESVKQEFIVVHGIVEDCILGLDALYEHRFMIDGHERCVYRVKESDQLPNRRDPFVLVASKLKLPPFSACVMESGGEGARVPPDFTLYLERNPRLPAGKSK
jgi:hypothetical protein